MLRPKSEAPEGQIWVEGLYSNPGYSFQTLPQTVLRNGLNANMSVFEVPLVFRYLISTENNSVNHVNYMQVSLNFEKMRARMLARYKVKQNLNAKPDTILSAGELMHVNAKIDGIETNLSAPGYSANLLQARQLLESIGADSAQFNTTEERQKIERARLLIAKDDSLRATLGALKDSRRDIQIEQNRKQHLQDIEQLKLQTDARYLKRKLKANNQLNKKEELLLNIRKLDIGQFAPSYSDLALSGISVRGVNVEYVPGSFYVSACTGKILGPSMLQQGSHEQSISAIRTGIGSSDKRYIGVIVTRTKSAADNFYTDSSGYMFKDGDALHYGVQGGFNYMKKFTTDFEYIIKSARHNTQDARQEDFANLHQRSDVLNNQAFQVRSTLNLPATKNSIEYVLRRTGSFYWAAGVPFLRRDVIRHQIKFKQKIYKTRVSFMSTVRFDRDNMSGYKATTTSNYQMNYALNLNFKRLPYAVLSFSPNQMELKGVINSKQLYTLNRFTIFSLLAGKNYHLKDIGFNTTVNLSRYESNVTDSGKTITHVLDIMHRTDIFSIGLAMLSHFNQNLDGKSTSPVFGQTIENSLEKQLGKWGTVSIGQHIRNSQVQRMTGINCGFSADGKRSGKFILTFELNKIKNYYFALPNYRPQYLLRLNYTFNLNSVK